MVRVSDIPCFRSMKANLVHLSCDVPGPFQNKLDPSVGLTCPPPYAVHVMAWPDLGGRLCDDDLGST
jgi:hypothetical protein